MDDAVVSGIISSFATAVIGSLIAPRWVKRKAKVEGDSTIVTSAIHLSEALERHASSLRSQIKEHEANSKAREVHYERRISDLEDLLRREKARCDGLEDKVHNMAREIDDLRRLVSEAHPDLQMSPGLGDAPHSIDSYLPDLPRSQTAPHAPTLPFPDLPDF